MHETFKTEAPPDKDTGRIESFSDGVFSIALTLLVLELKVPPVPAAPTAAALWAALGKQWPSYFAFLTSFGTVLVMWANHHGIFKLIRRSGANVLYANGFLLLLVTAVPFPTALVAAYLRSPAAPAACAVYAGTFVLIACSFSLLLTTAMRGGHLISAAAHAEFTRRNRDCYFIGLPLYVIATVVAPFSVWLSLGICTGLWVFWVGRSIERRAG